MGDAKMYVRSLWRVLGSRFNILRSCCQMRQIKPDFFGTKFVVKYWDAKHENRECCPQHGALSVFSVGLAFSIVTIAGSKPFLLPAAENWYLGNPYVLAPSA